VKRLVVALLVVLAALASATVGHAAAISVTSRSIASFVVQHPCPGLATAVPSSPSGSTFTGVTVTLPSAACAGRTVKLTVLNGATVVAQTAGVVVSGAVATFTTPAYTAAAGYTVRAIVDGWNLPTTWSYTSAVQPFTPGNPVTVVQSITWSTIGTAQCATVTVTTTTSSPSRWLVNLNIAGAPFNGATTGYVVNSGQVAFSPSATPQNGVIGIVGANNGWDTISSGQTRIFTICH
jgi:hypothetical protein